MRIFPGKIGPNDSTPNVRKQVDLVATVYPAIAGAPVYFKLWDVDDPFDQIHGPLGADDVPNVALIDNNQAGPDNRPVPEGPWTHTATTGLDGTATWTITVSMQPGNNYRAAASALADVFGPDPQVTQATADLLGVRTDAEGNFVANGGGHWKLGVAWSPMLTVWRKVHVELDSMGAPNATNTQTGLVQAAPTLDPNPANNNATIDIEDLDADWEQTDQHRVGRIDIVGFGSFTTVNTIKSAFDDQVVIINAPATIVNANGAAYTLWDDDAGSTPGFVMVGHDEPPVPLPVPPDTGFMAVAYAPAYILPVPDASGFNPQAPTPFDRQIVSTSMTDVRETANHPPNLNLTSGPAFWAVHVTSGFQGPPLQDFDPVTEAGLVYGVTDAWDDEPTAGGSIIHLEVIRDFNEEDAPGQTELEQFTVVHEVGHQFYLLHSNGAGGFIMTDQDGNTPFSPIREFSACSLMKMRKQQFPQGLDPKILCPGQN